MGTGFGYMLWGEGASLDEVRTVAFFVACFSQMFFALGCRSEGLTYSQVGLFTNRALGRDPDLRQPASLHRGVPRAAAYLRHRAAGA